MNRSRKVDEDVYARIIQLRLPPYSLTIAVIAERLGLSPRTVKVYLRQYRLETQRVEPEMIP